MTPQAIFFDLDGTLVDTAPDLGGAANHIRSSLGLEPLPLPDYRPVASAGARGLLRKAIGITRASRATAWRDLADLVAKQALEPIGAGRSSAYRIRWPG